MTAQWRITSIDIAHFRGVTDMLSVQFEPELNVLAGSNGSGKTSLCHAIEWALFGKVPVFIGDEFQAEDAIANRLANGPSKVILTLHRDSQLVRIMRTRPRGNSSTRGTSTVTLEADGGSFQGRDAETKITELLALDPNDFSTSMYLRQETIANLVLGDKELRSAAIDKLLGLGQIRELLENLQLSSLDRAIKQIDTETSSLQDGVIAAAGMRRVQLARKREELVTKGLNETALSMTGASLMLENSAADLDRLAKASGAKLSVTKRTSGTHSELQLSANELTSTLQFIDSALTDREVEVRNQTGRLEDLQRQYEHATGAMSDLRSVDLNGLKLQLEKLSVEKEEAEAQLRQARDLHLTVKPLCEQLDSLSSELITLRALVSEAESQDLEHHKSQVNGEVEGTLRLLDRQSALDRLLVNAKEYLAAQISDTCPVCMQPIDSQRTLARVNDLVAEGAQESTKLTTTLKELQAELQQIGQGIASLERNRALVTRIEGSWRDLLGRIAGKGLDIGDGSSETVRNIGKSVDDNYQNANLRRSELVEQYTQLQARIVGVESAQAELEGALSAIRELLGSEDAPVDVVSSITKALQQREGRLSEIAGTRQELGRIRVQLATAAEVIAFLHDVEEVNELEQNVPPIQRRLRQLAAARRRISDLREAASEVYNALTVAQQETLVGNLAALMPGVQDLFASLGGHPEYRQLVVEPENDQKTGTNVYRIRASSADGESSTYVRTIFSRAELNLVALALFVAVTRATNSRLGISIMDDPSQSLDVGRARALAEVLRALSQDRQVIIATENSNFVEWLTTDGYGQVIHLVHEPHQGTIIQH